MLVEPELLQQVQDAAGAHGVSVAAWMRHAMHHVTPENFPDSWHAGTASVRSHDSRTYGKRFMLRLDAATWTRLEELSQHFDTSSAEVIRQLVAQATPEDFPESWQCAVDERRHAHEQRGSAPPMRSRLHEGR
jgi:hypothetical protein